jgi:hypothetical protein
MTNLFSAAAFRGSKLIAEGDLADVARAVKAASDAGGAEPLLIFRDSDGRVVDVDLRGAPEAIDARLQTRFAPPKRAPGRPKLGVQAREITLLPRHWEWLGRQPGGASAAIRRLVEQAAKGDDAPTRKREAQEAAYRFMSAMAGDLPGYEDALRALFANERGPFDRLVQRWPADVRDYAKRLAAPAFTGER